MKKIFLSAIIVFFAVHCGGAALASESMTLEMEDGALLVTAADDIADAVSKRAESLKQELDSTEKVLGILKSQFGDGVTAELFGKPTVNMPGIKIERLTVREAVLRGALPPIEGLEIGAAGKVLSKCGFMIVAGELFSKMESGDAAKEAYLSEDGLVALTGTEPLDIVEILTVDVR